jgi:hypothetical protein
VPSKDVTAHVEKASGNIKAQLPKCSDLQAAILLILRAINGLRMWMAKRFNIAIDQDNALFMPKYYEGEVSRVPYLRLGKFRLGLKFSPVLEELFAGWAHVSADEFDHHWLS